MSCEIPTTTNGGVQESSPVNYQQTYTPTCNAGYGLNEDSVSALTCQADKSLNPKHPGCTSKLSVFKFLLVTSQVFFVIKYKNIKLVIN